MDEKAKSTKISSVRDLEVYMLAFDTAMELFNLSRNFPAEEKYSLVAQIVPIGLFKFIRRVEKAAI